MKSFGSVEFNSDSMEDLLAAEGGKFEDENERADDGGSFGREWLRIDFVSCYCI